MSAEKIWPVFTGDAETICKRVHQWALHHFEYVADADQFVVPENWPTPADIEASFARHGVLRDDCDGFTAMCRHALKLNGVRSRFVTCWVETGGYHAVCEADGWILDNRQLLCVPTTDLERSGYVWDRMSGYETGDDWHEVKLV